MDKILLAVLIMLIIGMGIAGYRHEWSMFYVMLGGTFVVAYLDAKKRRKKHGQERESRKK